MSDKQSKTSLSSGRRSIRNSRRSPSKTDRSKNKKAKLIEQNKEKLLKERKDVIQRFYLEIKNKEGVLKSPYVFKQEGKDTYEGEMKNVLKMLIFFIYDHHDFFHFLE